MPQIDSNLLLGTRKRMLIRHGDKRYLLRQTRRGKLILTGHEE
ncbi:MAG: hemin uptake protein HemP [Gammaproteobacteria bacterium]|nr:hemin uptake protein HemP [Gammaproteobacteria bacterium]